MSHPRLLVVVACLVLTGAWAEARPGKRHGRARHAGRPAEVEDGSARAAARAELRRLRAKRAQHAADDVAEDADRAESGESATHERTAFADPPDEAMDEAEDGQDDSVVDRTDTDDTDIGVTTARHAARHKDWQIAIGPYLWASSVDADVSLGPASVGTGIDFGTLQRHARYGAEVLADARYGRFSLAGDLMYGVVAVNGVKDVGPLMVSLDGTASSLLVDGMGGYRVLGDADSWFALEARGGVRYQRTAIAGSINVSGNKVTPPTSVDSATDALTGARVFLRPWTRLFVSSAVDVGIAGNSNLTWSAAADASLRITSRVLFSLGWRTLTTDRAHVSVVMHGPRAALQIVF